MNRQAFTMNCALRQNPHCYVFLLQTFPTSNHIIPQFFPTSLPHHAEFYKTFAMDDIKIEPPKTNHISFNQEYGEERNLDNLNGSSKMIKDRNEIEKNEEYDPKEYNPKAKNKKIYEKDKERNILPNAISKLFFFLKSTTKSEELLLKILNNQQSLNKNVTPSKYYSYQSLIKSKMTRFMSEESLWQLFTVQDPSFLVFSLQEQLAIIKINAIMIRNFLKKQMYLQSVVNTSRSHKNKVESYIKKYRVIEDQINKIMEDTVRKYNFNLIQ